MESDLEDIAKFLGVMEEIVDKNMELCDK